MECKQRTPSVIAKLMGLDALLPPQPVHKQQGVLSENYLRRTASIGVREKRSSHEGSSFWMNVEEQQEFKDVFEVPKTPMLDKLCTLSAQKEKANSSSNEAELAFIRQKYMGTECLSLDEKLQNSKEFHDAMEVLDSNRDLFLEFLQEPDFLFTKHLHDLQGVPLHPQLGHMTVLKSINSPNYRNNEIRRKSERTTKQGNVIKSRPKLENDLVTHSHEELGADYSDKLLKLPLEPKNETCLSPTRIVVLKPNLGKAQKAARSTFPPSSYEGCESGNRRHKDIPSFENGELFIEAGERKNLVDYVEPLRHRSRVSREIAKEITRKMKHSMSGSSMEASRHGFGGDDTSANESEIIAPSSPNSFDWKNRYQTSFSHSNGSFLAREAKKHLLERWKMTKRFQEVGLASRSSTLGELLAMPETHFPRSKSLLASSTAIRSPKTKTRHEALHNDMDLMAVEAVNREQNRSRMQNFGQTDGSKLRNSTSSCESFPCLDSETRAIMDELKNKHNEKDLNEQNCTVPKSSIGSVPCSDSETSYTLQETQVIQDELKENFEKDLSVRNLTVLNSSVSSVAFTSMVADLVADAKTGEVGMFSGIHMEQESKAMGRILFKKDEISTHHVVDALIRQETSIGFPEEGLVPLHCPDPQSPVRSEEARQPSPVSVLESPSKEEILPGTKSFESVSSDLHGLRVQLQLLKMESSEEHSEGPGIIVSSDEDTGEGSVGSVEENGEKMGFFRAEESRDFSYLVVVVREAGFYDRNLEICFKTWHSLECPINPKVFEMLEKKYCQQASWARSERRLLFDRINSGLMEILQRCMGIQAKSMARKLSFWWSWEVIEEELWMLLVSQEKEASKVSSEKVMGKEMKWLELGDDIDVIGGEIERMFIDELVTEIVSMEIF